MAKIIEAVGFAHKPGRNTIKADINRGMKRLFFWLLLRSRLSLAHEALRALLAVHAFMFGRRFSFISGASKGDTFENDLLKLIFNATTITGLARDDTSPVTDLHVSLHTTPGPGETGDQTTNEISYTGYARIAVVRTSSGWTVTTNSVSPVANIDFGQMTAGAGGTVTHFAVGTLLSGAGKVLYDGTVTPNIVVSNGVIPRLTTATAITED